MMKRTPEIVYAALSEGEPSNTGFLTKSEDLSKMCDEILGGAYVRTSMNSTERNWHDAGIYMSPCGSYEKHASKRIPLLTPANFRKKLEQVNSAASEATTKYSMLFRWFNDLAFFSKLLEKLLEKQSITEVEIASVRNDLGLIDLGTLRTKYEEIDPSLTEQVYSTKWGKGKRLYNSSK